MKLVQVKRHNSCPGYDIKQSDSEASVMVELWGMWSSPSLPLLPAPLWPEVVAPGRVLSMRQTELFVIWSVYLCKIELFEIEQFDYLTVCKQMSNV